MRFAFALLFLLLPIFPIGCGQHSPWGEEISPTGSPDGSTEDWEKDFSEMRRYSDPDFNEGGYYRYPGGRLRPRESDAALGNDDFYFNSTSPALDDPFAPRQEIEPGKELTEEEKERQRLESYPYPFGPRDSGSIFPPDPYETDPYRTPGEDLFRNFR